MSISEAEVMTSNIINSKELLQLLPHRYPFVMVDRVLDYKKGEYITALKNVTANEPYFAGHFPSNPVMPGVMMLEAMAQTAGLLIMLTYNNGKPDGDLYVFAGADKTRFRRMVIPGDQLKFQLQLLKGRNGLYKFLGEVFCEDALVCSSEIMVART